MLRNFEYARGKTAAAGANPSRLTYFNGQGSACGGECGPVFELHPALPKKRGRGGGFTVGAGDSPRPPSPGDRPKPLPAPEEEDGLCPGGKEVLPIFSNSVCSCSVHCCYGKGAGDRRGPLVESASHIQCMKKGSAGTTVLYVNLQYGNPGALSGFCGGGGFEIMAKAKGACGSGDSGCPHGTWGLGLKYGCCCGAGRLNEPKQKGVDELDTCCCEHDDCYSSSRINEKVVAFCLALGCLARILNPICKAMLDCDAELCRCAAGKPGTGRGAGTYRIGIMMLFCCALLSGRKKDHTRE
jgi:hypothetical protein